MVSSSHRNEVWQDSALLAWSAEGKPTISPPRFLFGSDLIEAERLRYSVYREGIKAGRALSPADRGTRQVWFGGWHAATVHDRLALPVGAEIHGPAILEQPDATTVVDPGLVARVDRFGNVIVTRA